MMVRTLLILAAAALAGSASAPAAAPRPATASHALRLIDLTDEFAAFEAQSRDLQGSVRADAFKAYFAPLLPGFYSNARVPSPRFDERILAALANWPQDRAGVETVSRRFADMLAPAQSSFEEAFGPMTGYPPIYLVHSLGEFDGGTRSLPEGGRLLFGADMVARYHLAHDIRPFFHHELFHLFHARTFSECEAIWCGLWTEGLATYIAASLNPGATDAELLLTVPEPIRPAVDANRIEAICAVAARLDSTEADAGRALFSFRRMNERLPPRFGYYVGYLAAAELGRTRSLRQLAAMSASEVRPALEAALRRLASCSDG